MANKLKVKNQKVNEVPTSLANKYANDNATAVADKGTKKDITRDKKQTYTKAVPTKTTEEFFRERMSRYTPSNQVSTGALKNEVKPKTNDELKSFVKSRMSMYAKDNTDDHTKASGYSDYYMSYLKKAGKDNTRATSFADAKKEEKKRAYTSFNDAYNLMDDYSKQDLENLYKSDTNAKELARVGANKKGNKLSEAKNRIQKILEANEKQKEQSRKFFGDNKRNIKNIDEYKYKILRNEYAYDMMTDEQKEVYNYLYATKSPEYANTYKSMLDDELNAKVGKQEYEQTLDNKSGFEKFGKHVGTSIADSVHDTVIGNLNFLTGNKYIAPRSVDEFLSSEIRNDKDNSGAYNTALDLGSTIGRQVPGIAMSLATGVPIAGMITTSLDASGSAYEDSIREGKTVNQARLYGAVQGGAEMITGELLNGIAGIGEGVLSKALKSETASKAFNKAFSIFSKTDLGKKVADTAYKTGVDMFSEGLEEYLQEHIDKVSRNLIFGENNKISLDDPQAWYSAMLGAMSAGLLNAPGTAHDIRNDIKQVNAPIDIKEGSYKLPEAKKYEVPNTDLDNKYIPSVEDVHRSSTEPSLYEKAYNLYMNNKLSEDNNVKPYYEAYNENIDTDTAYLHKTQEEIERVARDNDIKLSSIEESSNQFGEYGKNAFIENYEPKGSLNTLTYEDGFKAAYEAGKERLGHASISTPAYHMLSSEQQIAAYNAGLIDYERSNNVKPLANVEGGLIQTENETARYNNILADKVGKYTGLQVVVANELPHDANGAYHAKDNKMYLSLNAENYNAVAGHELTHFIKNYDEKNYNLYMDTVLKAYTSAKGKSIDNLITEYGSRYGSNMSRESILEEIVADGSAHFFNDEKFINNISKDNTSLGKSIVNFINDMIEAINNLISKTTNRDIADTLKANKKMYEKARKHWLDGLENASKINKSNLETREEPKLKDTKSKGIVEDDKGFLRLDENRDTDDNLPFESKKVGSSRKVASIGELIERVESNPNDNWSVFEIAEKVNDRLAKEIERLTGIDVTGWRVELSADRMRHAIKRHGKNGSADRTMSNYEDFSLIPKVQEEFTDIRLTENTNTYRDGNGNFSKTVLLTMKDGNGYVHVAEAIPDTKKRTIQIVSAYKSQKYLDKKNTPYSVLNGMKNSPKLHVQNAAKLGVNNKVARNKKKINDDTKFSLKKEVEEGKNLIAVHNLTSNKLEKALELGAFPMPSIAITKSDMGHTNFGDISLVFGKETIDPSVKGQKVYSADAWTPTFPITEYEANFDKVWYHYQALKPYIEQLPTKYREMIETEFSTLHSNWNDYKGKSGFIDSFTNSKTDNVYAMKALYLLQKDIKVQDFTEANIDKTDMRGYEKWLTNLAEDIEEASGIPNGKDIFTPSGSRRTFKQLHLEITAENIVKSMLKQSKDNINVVGFNGVKSIRASSATSFKQISDIKKSSYKLQNLNEETIVALDDKLINLLSDIATYNNKSDDFFGISRIGDVILEVSEKKRNTVKDIISKFKLYSWDITENQARDVKELIELVKEMPVNMFEAKPERVVNFNEIKYALIPSDEIEAIKGLRNKGVEVIEYARNEDIDPRVEILNSLDDVKFSIKKDNNGDNIVVIDKNIIKGVKNKDLKRFVKNELKKNVGSYYTIIQNSKEIYLGKDLPNEYVYSEYTKKMKNSELKVKAQASNNIRELIQIATNEEWKENIKLKHSEDAKYGWYRYDTRFAIPKVENNDGVIGYDTYSASLIIKHSSDGKKYLYDMIKIKRDASGTLTLADKSNATINPNTSLSNETIVQETSNKVNTQNEIKNSLKLSDNASTDIKTLQKENSYLKRKVESLKEEFKLTKGYEPKSEDVDRMATRLKTSLNSRYSKEALSENLTKIFKYINKYNGEYTSDVMEISANLAKDVLLDSRDLEKSTNPELKEIRKAIKSYDIKLSDIDLAELEVLGGYDNIRKKYFGKLVLSKTKGLGVDSVYKELSSTYPWVFNENINNTSDQLFRILDVISMTEDTNFNEYGMDTDEYAYMVAEDIFSMYFDVRQKQTFADIQKAKLEKTKAAYDMSYYERLKDLNEKHKKEMLEQRNRLKEDYKIKLREYKRENTKKIAELTKEYNKKMSELRKEKNASRDKAKIKELENKIAKLTKAQTQQINAHYNINYANILATNNSNPNEFIQSKELNRLQINPFIAKSDSDYAIANLDEKVKECCETYGIIPKGNNPLRDIDVPKAVSDEKKVSRLARTVLESDYVIDDLVEPIKDELLNGRFSYYEKSNSYASIQAENIIKRQGYNGAMTAWEEAVYRGNPSKEDIVLAEALLKIASENKKASDVLKILSQLQAVSTNAGQVVQAISMLKTNKVSEDLIKSIDLMAVKDIERNINRDLIKKYSNNRGYIPEVKLNEDLVKKLVEASTEEEVSKTKMEVIEDLASQIPSTWVDKWNAWRYLSMLGNPKTHIRNVLGNAIFYPVVRMRNYISYSLENTVFNNISTKTKAVMIEGKYKEFANKDYDLVKDILDGGGKYDQMNLIRQKRTIFKLNGDTKISKLGTKVLSGLEKASRFNSDMLELEDQIFISGYYKRFFAEYLQANKVDLSNVSEMSLNKAREYAINEAKKATYRDESKIASSLNNLARTSKGADIFVNGVLPFKKTPLKILQRSFEYSPFGVAKALTYDIKNVRSGKISINEYIDNLSAGITGSTLMALGFYMANLGLLSGGDDEDKNVNTLERLSKKQNYSLKIGDYSYTLDWSAPSSIPLFMGVELSKSFKEDNNDVSSVLDIMLNIPAPMFNLSMLKGFNDTLTTVGYAQGSNKITALGSSVVENYIGQAIPTILGQIARTIDPVQRGTYYDKNDGTPREVQRFLQKSFYNKLPFLSMKSEPVLDQFGNETVDDNVLSRVFQNFISPGYYKMQVDDEVYSEIDRLYKDTGEGKVILKNPKKGFKIVDENGDKKDYYMSASEYTAYKKLSGPLSYQLVHNLINDDRYSELEDTDRVAIIAKAYDYATQVSRYEINNSYSVDSFTTKAIEAYNEGVSLNDYLYYYQMLKTSGITKKKDRENFFENENLDTETKKALIKLLGK